MEAAAGGSAGACCLHCPLPPVLSGNCKASCLRTVVEETVPSAGQNSRGSPQINGNAFLKGQDRSSVSSALRILQAVTKDIAMHCSFLQTWFSYILLLQISLRRTKHTHEMMSETPLKLSMYPNTQTQSRVQNPNSSCSSST